MSTSMQEVEQLYKKIHYENSNVHKENKIVEKLTLVFKKHDPVDYTRYRNNFVPIIGAEISGYCYEFVVKNISIDVVVDNILSRVFVFLNDSDKSYEPQWKWTITNPSNYNTIDTLLKNKKLQDSDDFNCIMNSLDGIISGL